LRLRREYLILRWGIIIGRLVADASSVHPLHFNAIFYRPLLQPLLPLGFLRRGSTIAANVLCLLVAATCGRQSEFWASLPEGGFLSNLGDGSTDEVTQKRRLILERKVSKWEHNLSMSLPECDFDTP